MKDLLKKSLLYFDNLNFNYKTAFLVFIIAGGMICIIILSTYVTLHSFYLLLIHELNLKIVFHFLKMLKFF